MMEDDHRPVLRFAGFVARRGTRAPAPYTEPALHAALGLGVALALCLVLAFCAAPGAHAAFGVPVLVPPTVPPPAPVKDSAVLTTTFSPDRLGARGALTFSIRYGVGSSKEISPAEFLVPSPVRRLAVRFPAGMGLDIPNLRGCSTARLRAHGVRGCPAASRVGGGYALTDLPAGSQILNERITLSAFVGPLRNGQPTLVILAEGYTPLGERIVFTGEIRFVRAPYGEELVLNVPPIRTIPQTPDAVPVLFSLTLGVSSRARSSSANTVIVPSRCPAGGFPFAADSTLANGARVSALSRSRCPRAHRGG
jgi:hypothetical protein